MSDSQWEWLVVFTLVLGLIVLAAAIALGKVEQQTSFGLQQVLESLKMATGIVLGFKFARIGGNGNSEKK